MTSKDAELLSAVQEAYRLLFEAKMDFHESAAKTHRLAARNLLKSVVERIGEEGELTDGWATFETAGPLSGFETWKEKAG